MNPDPDECDCCPPASCEACEPQCSTEPHVMIRAERPLKSEFVCSTKNCNIFGSHDTNPMPEYQYRKQGSKIKDENKNSLGSPIGLVASNVNFKTEGKTSDIIQARYATYLKAFARLHLNAETSWNSVVIDDIMKEGLILYSYSQKEETIVESPADIYMPNEENILREFELSDFTFHVELMAPYKLNPTASVETGAQGDGVELTLEDLKTVLKQFFRQHKYGLMTVGTFYVMLWRSTEAYFVFDACGRRVADFQADKDKGVAMLICLSSLENVRHLIVNLSGLQMSEPFVIREMKVVKVVTPSGAIMQQDYTKRTHQYQVVNDDYAYLKSALHLTLNRRDLVRNRSALPVAVAAIIVSKIDHPATWDMKMLDKIICFGVNFCQARWVNYRGTEVIDVTEFPTYLTMGQFQITIEILARKYEGTWRCVPDFKHSELAQAIKKAVDTTGEQKLLVQINYQMYAIWKKQDFIYLLDPYRHRILGKSAESEVYEEMEKSATVRMFGSFEVFMNVFNHILLDSNRTSPFFVHTVKVKNIQKRITVKEASVRPVEDTKHDANGEIISINEHICFEEGEDLCQKALGEISDYEDEDLKSDVIEMELRTSSSEAEVMEEEEAAAGELEEMEGLESSSSGEEGGGHKKKAAGKSDKTKAGKGKSSGKGGKGKGGSGKGKKGEGPKDAEAGGKKRKKQKDDESGESSEEEGGKTKKSKKVKNIEDDDKSNKKDKTGKSKGGDQTGTGKEDDEVTKDDKLKQAKSKQDKGDAEKDIKNKELKDRDLKDKDPKDKDFKDQDKNINKDGKLMSEVDDDNALKKLKEKKGLDNKTLDQKGDRKFLNTDVDQQDKNEKDSAKGRTQAADKGESKGPGKDEGKADTNSTADKTDQNKGVGKDAGKADKKLTADETGLRKAEGTIDTNLNKDQMGADQDKPQPDKNVLKDGSKSDKDLAIETRPEGDKKTPQTEQQIEDGNSKLDQTKTKDKDLKDGAEQEKGSDKENAKGRDVNKDLEKDLKGKTQYIDKSNQDTHKKTMDTLDHEDDLKQKKTKYGDKKRRGDERSGLYDDGTEADDENEEYFKKKQHYCSVPKPNRYPGYFKYPLDMAVVGSESGSYESICKLFQAGFKVADRLLAMTPWGNFVIFRCCDKRKALAGKHYFLYDGCTCNFERFRHLDLSVGTAGLICFKHTHNIIEYIRHLRKWRRRVKEELPPYTADDICRQYSNLRV